MRDLDPVEALMVMVVAVLLMFALVVMVDIASRQKPQVNDDECRMTSQKETGRRIYCGKACFRREVEETYSCKDGSSYVRIH